MTNLAIINCNCGQNLECHIGKEHKALSANLKAVLQNILHKAPASVNTNVTPKTPTVASATISTPTPTGARQKNKTATQTSRTNKKILPTRIQHKRAVNLFN